MEIIKKLARDIGLMLIGAIMLGNIIAFIYLDNKINNVNSGLINVVNYLNQHTQPNQGMNK